MPQPPARTGLDSDRIRGRECFRVRAGWNGHPEATGPFPGRPASELENVRRYRGEGTRAMTSGTSMRSCGHSGWNQGPWRASGDCSCGLERWRVSRSSHRRDAAIEVQVFSWRLQLRQQPDSLGSQSFCLRRRASVSSIRATGASASAPAVREDATWARRGRGRRSSATIGVAHRRAAWAAHRTATLVMRECCSQALLCVPRANHHGGHRRLSSQY